MTPYKRPDSPYWHIDFKPAGYDHRIRRSTGLTSKRQARQVEATLERLAVDGNHDVLDRVREGELHPTDVHGAARAGELGELTDDADDPPLEVVARDFVDAHPDERLSYAIDRLLTVAPDDARLSWVRDPDNLRELLRYYRSEGYAASTEHREMSGIRQLVQQAYDEQTRVEVFENLSLRPKPNRRIRYMEPDEIEAVREAAGEYWLVYGTYIATGMRRRELVERLVRDFDLERGAVTIEMSKTDKGERTVPFGGEMLALLRGWVASQDLGSADPIFPGVTYDIVYERWKEVRKRAGLEDVTIHSLRHTYAVHMARAGMPLPTLMDRLGHAKIETTMRYARYRPSERTSHDDLGLENMGLRGEEPTLDPKREGPSLEDDDADTGEATG